MLLACFANANIKALHQTRFKSIRQLPNFMPMKAIQFVHNQNKVGCLMQISIYTKNAKEQVDRHIVIREYCNN